MLFLPQRLAKYVLDSLFKVVLGIQAPERNRQSAAVLEGHSWKFFGGKQLLWDLFQTGIPFSREYPSLFTDVLWVQAAAFPR